MAIHRRPLGSGRTLAAIAGAVIIVGCVLPWWRRGGDATGLPALTGYAFEDVGIIVFLVGVATLALVALPYAVGDRPTGIDRWMSYAVLCHRRLGRVRLAAGAALRRWTCSGSPSRPRSSPTAPGLWLVGLGLGVLSRAVWRMTREPLYR